MRLMLQRLAITLVVVGLTGYWIYELSTETGMVGWLNWGQQALTGSYSWKLSAVVSMLVMIMGGGIVVGALSMMGGVPDPKADQALFGAPGPQGETQPVSVKGAIGVGLVLSAIAWAIGLGWYFWNGWQQRSDLNATYEPVVLRDGQAPPSPVGRHLALQGRLLGDHVLTHTKKGGASSKREDYHLVPVAAPGWVAGQPVPYVVKVAHLGELQAYVDAQRRGAPTPLLVRLDGALPVPALQQFEKSGVALASGARMLAVVPSSDGKPLVLDTSERDLTLVLILCGLVTAILLLVFPLAWWRGTRVTPARA